VGIWDTPGVRNDGASATRKDYPRDVSGTVRSGEGKWGAEGRDTITVRNSSKGGIRITGGSKERRTKVDEGRVPSVTRKNNPQLDGEGTTGRCDVEDRSVKEEGKGGGPTNPMRARGSGPPPANGHRTLAKGQRGGQGHEYKEGRKISMWLTRQGQAREVDVPGGGSNGAMHADLCYQKIGVWGSRITAGASEDNPEGKS